MSSMPTHCRTMPPEVATPQRKRYQKAKRMVTQDSDFSFGQISHANTLQVR